MTNTGKGKTKKQKKKSVKNDIDKRATLKHDWWELSNFVERRKAILT